jgi:hypothetical protein
MQQFFTAIKAGEIKNKTADLLNAIVSINWITLFFGFF